MAPSNTSPASQTVDTDSIWNREVAKNKAWADAANRICDVLTKGFGRFFGVTTNTDHVLTVNFAPKQLDWKFHMPAGLPRERFLIDVVAMVSDDFVRSHSDLILPFNRGTFNVNDE